MIQQRQSESSGLTSVWRAVFSGASRSTRVAWSIVLLITLGVLATSLLSFEPMVGDEVTHFYMLKHQSETLPVPNFHAYIETEFGDEPEMRGYPHAFFWHYAGAIVYRVCGESLLALHLFHWLFLVQLLLATLYLVWPGRRICELPDALAVAFALSLPMTLLFSVTFYLDVPASAQGVTAFACCSRRKWGWGAVCLALAVGIKESMILMVPGYLAYLVFTLGRRQWRTTLLALATSAACLVAVCGLTAWTLWHFERTTYYPTDMLRVVINRALDALPSPEPEPEPESAGETSVVPEKPDRRVSMYKEDVIANHPSDLRVPINWVVFGGGPLYVLGALSLLVLIWKLFQRKRLEGHDVMLAIAGVLYVAGASYFLREAPAARFFMPGLYLLIPASVGLARRLFAIRWICVLALVLVVVQSSGVLYKAYSLRRVATGIRQTIQFLGQNPPQPNRVFMYPEGNYRLFPCPHDWYLGYRLRDFWEGDNDARLAILHKRKIGAVVVKRHLVGEIDEEMNNLGVYPTYFLRDMEADERFVEIFENDAARVFSVPARPSP